MRIVYMGTPDFAVGSLENLINAGHDIACVVTQPDKPKGRGKELAMSPVKEFALKKGLKVISPTKVRTKEFIEEIRSYNADAIVVVAYGRILVPEIIEMPRFGCINVHASLLPKYRGAAPIQWAIFNGDEKSGVTTMHMDNGLDTGDMLLTKEVEISKDETGGSLFDKLSVVGADLIVETLEKLEKGEIVPIPQDETKATSVSMIKKEDGLLNFSKSAKELECQVRAFTPWPSSYTFVNGKNLKVWKAWVIDKDYDVNPGTIIGVDDGIMVACKKGTLCIKELQIEGKKRMNYDDFLRGTRLSTGTVLG